MAIAHKGLLVASFVTLALSVADWAQAADQPYVPKVGQGGKDVVWVPTSQAVVDQMLDMAGLTPDDKLVDLGSGDGITVISAAKRGAMARGIEYNPDMVALSKQNAEKAGVSERASFDEADIFESDFSDANVVTMFLLPDLNVRLRPKLLDMEPGTRIVTNSFTMDDWQPDDSTQVQNCASYCYVYKWVVPAKVGGSWNLGDQQLVLTQRYQLLEGNLEGADASTPITEARVDGKRVSFTANGHHYVGEVEGTTMRGTVDESEEWTATFVES
ncbi:class I SAM-dependent methyltransferase [Pseudomonas matsuisoli]|uniref:Methyltransferase n=1 Tax=Pseudomonas matsuisoli TaxID=1515666 RepID=A0A917PPE8_9PSED|nr:class I SAM-dependent methyltransferase [Pseudomonas matsuisoli]GGJ86362.1 methyltransferase [Pseudomonas matsuisoli]